MDREDCADLFVKVPLSHVRFSDPLEQRKFEKRLADDEDKKQIIQEIEAIVQEQTLELTT